MSKDSGFLVMTKSGRRGRTYHRENLVRGKVVVHVDDGAGRVVKMLCDPKSITVIGFVG